LKYNDHILYIVVCTMAVSYVACQGAALWLGWNDKAVPDFIIQSGGQSGGALLAILLAVNTVITRQNSNVQNHHTEDLQLPIRREKHGE